VNLQLKEVCDGVLSGIKVNMEGHNDLNIMKTHNLKNIRNILLKVLNI
jgi:hypothetical protein